MRFRFHFSTWIVLFLTASVLLGLHVNPIEYRLKAGHDELHAVTSGFPLLVSSSFVHQSGSYSMSGMPIALFNFIFVLLPIAFLLEPESRRFISFISFRSLLSLFIAGSIGLSLGFDSILHTECISNSSYVSKSSHGSIPAVSGDIAFYRKGWPFSAYAGICQRSTLPDEILITYTSGRQQRLL